VRLCLRAPFGSRTNKPIFDLKNVPTSAPVVSANHYTLWSAVGGRSRKIRATYLFRGRGFTEGPIYKGESLEMALARISRDNRDESLLVYCV
jgi:hypothetical protein